MSRGRGSRVSAPDTMRVAFDSRRCVEVRGVGRYARGLLGGLDSVVGEGIEIVETHRPRHVDVYHSPWIDGAILRSPCPMVVTIHDIDALTRPSERLRCGGIYLRLRHLALARATHAIVPTEAVAEDAVSRLGLEPGRVVVIAPVSKSSSAWTWEDMARATWKVYERALSEPGRAFVSTPPAASARLESS
jgi:Glycosyltransferase Family 4